MVFLPPLECVFTFVPLSQKCCVSFQSYPPFSLPQIVIVIDFSFSPSAAALWIIFVIIGAADYGKTAVMAVMREKPPGTCESTGCATCPVRCMATTRISKSGHVWTQVPYSQIFWQLATVLHSKCRG